MSGGPAKKGEKRRKIIRDGKNRRLKSPVKINKNNMEKSVFYVYFYPVLTAYPYFLPHFYFMVFLLGLFTSLLLYGFSFGSWFVFFV
ncbi:hypothetical protein MSLAZ_1100 [Methanosarcina lacustris Z-7289]|uniref:Uncharacterized protein n=1 Tax=Methanosarcina lacustris Z-7289 TaxID=1434111 RepID=A0A0E3S2K4_9EURY|nr:hypothetical protein MSLAZ_1100 [Methanosarcina lacustris Z-7289]